jgi:hypothetical protein
MKWGTSGNATHSAHDERPAAPKLFFRVMELIPTSARPWQGDTKMFFFSPKKMGI